MISINYEKLGAVTGLSQQQVKRIALGLFGKDETESGGRGVVREFSLNEAFYVGLAKRFIVDHGMKISEARRVVFRLINVITDLQRELQMWLLPERIWRAKAEKPFPRIVLRIYVTDLVEVRIYDREPIIECLQETKEISHPGMDEPFTATENKERLDEGPCTVLFYPQGSSLYDEPKRLLCELELRDLLSEFAYAVKSLG